MAWFATRVQRGSTQVTRLLYIIGFSFSVIYICVLTIARTIRIIITIARRRHLNITVFHVESIGKILYTVNNH